MSLPYYVRRLTAVERRDLSELCKRAPSSRVARRAQAILMSADGQTTHQIGLMLRCCHSTVFRWLKRFDEKGVEACNPGKSSGRPLKADHKVEAAVKKAVGINPHDLGYDFTRWTRTLLAEHIESQHRLSLHPATIGKMLRRMAYRYGSPKLDLKHRQDPVDVKRAARERRLALKKQPTV
jgi:transposase